MKKTLLTLSMLFASVAMAQEVETVKPEVATQEIPAQEVKTVKPEEATPAITEETELKEEAVTEETPEMELDEVTTSTDVKE